MANLSRPFQIVLVAILVLAGIGVFALQGHSTSTGTSSSSAPSVSVTRSAPAPAPSAHGATLAQREAASAAAPTPVYHGSAPGVEGLTRAIAKAHEAVAISQANANKLAQSSRRASGEAPESNATAAQPSAGSHPGARAARPSVRPGATPKTAAARHASGPPSARSHRSSVLASTLDPARERAVEAELKSGDVAVILFWNPSGFDDQLVHEQLKRVSSGAASRHVVVQEASSSEVASYGAITRGVQIFSTPTVLVINPRGQVITITGMTDAYAIEQAIQEARGA